MSAVRNPLDHYKVDFKLIFVVEEKYLILIQFYNPHIQLCDPLGSFNYQFDKSRSRLYFSGELLYEARIEMSY